MAPPSGSDLTSQSDPPGTSIAGTIEFQDVAEPAMGVTVRVRVQDTVRADAKARTVAEQVIPNVTIVTGAPALPFRVEGVPEDPNAQYTVRVHADVDGDGRVSKGDFISMQSFPAKTGGEEALAVVARRVL
jgi:hypothetical protein